MGILPRYAPRPGSIRRSRLKLTTKRVRKGYYKGNQTGSMGDFKPYPGNWTNFRISYDKVRTYTPPPGWVFGGPAAVNRMLNAYQLEATGGKVATPGDAKKKDLKPPPLTPFVPKYHPRPAESIEFEQYRSTGGPVSGLLYLDRWKELNGRT